MSENVIKVGPQCVYGLHNDCTFMPCECDCHMDKPRMKFQWQSVAALVFMMALFWLGLALITAFLVHVL
jgi:hypothetical protein